MGLIVLKSLQKRFDYKFLFRKIINRKLSSIESFYNFQPETIGRTGEAICGFFKIVLYI